MTPEQLTRRCEELNTFMVDMRGRIAKLEFDAHPAVDLGPMLRRMRSIEDFIFRGQPVMPVEPKDKPMEDLSGPAENSDDFYLMRRRLDYAQGEVVRLLSQVAALQARNNLLQGRLNDYRDALLEPKRTGV